MLRSLSKQPFNKPRDQPNILIKINDNWIPADEYQIDAFIDYDKNNKYGIYEYSKNGHNITLQQIQYNKMYIINQDNVHIPIADWNNVKIFVYDRPNVGYHLTHDYQTSAYFDFIYSGENEMMYSNETKETPFVSISQLYDTKNKSFVLKRCESGSITYKNTNKNNEPENKISNSRFARCGYLGFLNRVYDFQSNSEEIDLYDSYVPIVKNQECITNCIVC